MAVDIGLLGVEKRGFALFLGKRLGNDAPHVLHRVENVAAGPDIFRNIAPDVLNQDAHAARLGFRRAQGPADGVELLLGGVEHPAMLLVFERHVVGLARGNDVHGTAYLAGIGLDVGGVVAQHVEIELRFREHLGEIDK